MKVKELVDRLKKVNPDLDIYVTRDKDAGAMTPLKGAEVVPISKQDFSYLDEMIYGFDSREDVIVID